MKIGVLKKAIAIIVMLAVLSIATLAVITTVSAQPLTGTFGNNFTWTLDTVTGELTITGTGQMEDFGYYGAVPWYSNRNSIKTVKIEEGVTSISSYSFYGCKTLISVSIPESVERISHDSFYGCTGLSSLTIPKGVSYIESFAFDGCSSSLESIIVDEGNETFKSVDNCLINKNSKMLLLGCNNSVIPADGSVTSIGEKAFYNCAELTNVTIPNGVTSIGSGAFSGCISITDIIIPDSVTDIGSSAFSSCTGLLSATLPKNITQIVDGLFYGCTSIDGVKIPDSVKEIGANAFRECTSLESIDIPANVDTIYSSAFDGCTKLAKVSFAENSKLETVANGAFLGCSSLESITLPESVLSVYRNCFYDCTGLKSVIFEGDSAEIESYAFYNCPSLENVILPAGLPAIEEYTFYGCTSISEIDIPDNVKSIGNYAFWGCTGLVEISIPKGTESVGAGAFRGCIALTTLTFEEGVKTIGSEAFAECANLKTVNISNTVESIGYSAFYLCRNISRVNITDIGAWCNISFDSDQSNPVYFAKCLYMDGEMITELVIPEGTESVGTYAFYHCNGITSITIPASVTQINNNAFSFCYSLTSITLEENINLESIGEWAFSGCMKLVEIINHSDMILETGSESYGRIAYYAKDIHSGESEIVNKDGFLFYTCDDTNYLLGHFGFLEEVVTPDDYNGEKYEIYQYAFYDHMDCLESIVVSEGVTNIGEYAISSCSNISKIILPNSLEKIEDHACEGQIIFCGTKNEWKALTLETDWQYCTIQYHSFIDGVCEGCGFEGAPITWVFDEETGKLTIYGSIDMSDYSSSEAPWYLYNNEVCSVEVSEGVKSIGSHAFSFFSNLENVKIPDSVTIIGESAFAFCTSLTTVTIPDTVTVIERDAFNYCRALSKVILGANSKLTSIGRAAFEYCNSLESITIPSGVEIIDEKTFANCENLEAITIPKNVTEIRYGAFEGCMTLGDVRFEKGSKLTKIESYVFSGCESIGPIIYCGTEEEWNAIEKDSYDWEYKTVWFHRYITFSGSNICNVCGTSDQRYLSGFAGVGLTWTFDTENGTFTVSGTGDMIDTYSPEWFALAPLVNTVVIEDGATSIGMYAFSGFKKLTSVTIPSSVKRISEYAFNNCDSLTEVVIPDGVNVMSYRVFSDCNNLSKVVLPDSLTNIGTACFNSCGSLKTLIYCGEEADWNNVTKDSYWNSGASFAVQYHNYVEDVCTECGHKMGESDLSLGDANGDMLITNADVLMIYRYIYNAELYPLDITVADVNKDGYVTNADVLMIYRYIYNPTLYPLG